MLLAINPFAAKVRAGTGAVHSRGRTLSCRVSHWLFASLLTVVAGQLQAAEMPGSARVETPSAAQLEQAGARIRRVDIVIQPIFDEDKPGERKRLFRWANRLHIPTRAAAVRAQLLFRPGDLFSEHTLRETERNLRQLRFLREPQIRIVAVVDGQVDLEVRSTDVWTIDPSLHFGRSGGSNRTSIGLDDFNFLGLGKRLKVGFSRDRDRDSKSIAYSDPNLGFGRMQLDSEIQQNSDGHLFSFNLARPFFELDARRSYGISGSDEDSLQRRYALGEEVDVYRRRMLGAELFFGQSEGLSDGWVRRRTFGLRYEDSRFDGYLPGPTAAPAPADRQLLVPYLRYEWIEDDFSTTINRNQIARTEDEQFGQRWLLEFGAAGAAFGSDRDAVLLRAEVSDGFHLDDRQSLFVNAALRGRVQNGEIADRDLGVAARYYLRFNEQHSFYAGLQMDFGQKLDDDREFLLGGDNGLRAYPIAFQTGEKRALLTVEQRYFTNWQPFRLFTVGAAVFADVGRVWGPNSINAPNLGTLREVGIGLRLGSLRSARANVLHIDLAWPLDDPNHSGPALMIESRSSF